MTIPHRRTFTKWLHWLSSGLILYFFLVEPDVPERGSAAAQTAGLSTHAGMGVLLAIVVLIWTAMYMRKGMLGRPGPKLPNRLKTLHVWMHKALHIGMPVILATGLAAGLAAPFAVMAFEIIPLNVAGIGSEGIHDLAQEIHEIAFDGLLVLIVVHAVFHVWRHYLLKDNALKLMAPKVLHRYL